MAKRKSTKDKQRSTKHTHKVHYTLMHKLLIKFGDIMTLKIAQITIVIKSLIFIQNSII